MSKRREKEPWIWLQDGEWSGKADGCGCHLDAGGPREERGAAFYICLKHEKAEDMKRELRQAAKSLDVLAEDAEELGYSARSGAATRQAMKIRTLLREIS